MGTHHSNSVMNQGRTCLFIMLAASWDLPTLTNRIMAVHIGVLILDAAQPDPDVYINMLETLATCPTAC